MNKRGDLIGKYTVHIIIAASLILLFLYHTYSKGDSRYVKQQIVEKQIALLIESASPGMVFYIQKNHRDGTINSIRIENSRVYAGIDNFPERRGYPFTTQYSVRVTFEHGEYKIEVT